MREPTSEEITAMMDELPDERLDSLAEMDTIEEVKETQDVQDLALESMLERVSELNIKVVNLAMKLDAHLHERDAHNPAILKT